MNGKVCQPKFGEYYGSGGMGIWEGGSLRRGGPTDRGGVGERGE